MKPHYLALAYSVKKPNHIYTRVKLAGGFEHIACLPQSLPKMNIFNQNHHG